MERDRQVKFEVYWAYKEPDAVADLEVFTPVMESQKILLYSFMKDILLTKYFFLRRIFYIESILNTHNIVPLNQNLYP